MQTMQIMATYKLGQGPIIFFFFFGGGGGVLPSIGYIIIIPANSHALGVSLTPAG